jgi:aminopeptidase N
MRIRAGAAVCVLLLAGCTSGKHPTELPAASRTSAPAFTPGAQGIGDDYFPTYGNGGYDVRGYDLNLRYDPAAGQLSGTATITATATQDLSRFDFDFANLRAGKVTVDGTVAAASQNGNELVITPVGGIVKTAAFTVVVAYAGKPSALDNKSLGEGGWLRTKDGGFALGQPESASTWYPVNDHPADKATFKLAMAVPTGLQVISNGVPGPRSSASGWTTWTWSEAAPMASYLSTVVIGHYRVTTSKHDGKPMIIAIPDSLPATGPAAKSVARTGEIADFLATRFGPYPFDAYGAIVVDDQRINYALETQTRPTYGSTFFRGGPDATVVAHELAHQWYGDSVALDRWQDIWLNEGFATYAEWLWQEHEGDQTVRQSFDRAYNGFNWSVPTGNPGANRIFGDAVYTRGAMTVEALRRTIGDPAFFALLKAWPAKHRDGNGTTGEFIAAAEAAGGQDLGPLFQAWLFGTTKPAKP